jgi:hypothetical protein
VPTLPSGVEHEFKDAEHNQEKMDEHIHYLWIGFFITADECCREVVFFEGGLY